MASCVASPPACTDPVDEQRGWHLLRPGIYWDLLSELMHVAAQIILPTLETPHEDVDTTTFLQLLTSLKQHQERVRRKASTRGGLLSETTILKLLSSSCEVVLQFDYYGAARKIGAEAQLFRRADRRFRPPDLATYHSDPPMIGIWALGCIAYELYFLQQISTRMLREFYHSDTITNTQELIRCCLATDYRDRISAKKLHADALHFLAAEEKMQLFLMPRAPKFNDATFSIDDSSDTSRNTTFNMGGIQVPALTIYMASNPYASPAVGATSRKAEPLPTGVRSPLIEAARKGDAREIRRLLSTPQIAAYIGRYDPDTGRTALMAAAEAGCEDGVIALLDFRYTFLQFTEKPAEFITEHGIIICFDRWSEQRYEFTVHCYGYRPMTDHKLVEAKQSDDLFCALSLAIRAGHWACVRHLAAHEAEFMHFTPLMAAAVSGDSNLVVSSLQYLNQRCENVTAVMLAAVYGNVKCLEIMLSAISIDWNPPFENWEGEIALPVEVFGRTNKKTGCMNALMLAIANRQQTSAYTILNYIPFTARQQSMTGATALMLAAAQGYSDLVSILLPQEFQLADYCGQTVVAYAAGSTSYGTGSQQCLDIVAQFLCDNCGVTNMICRIITRTIDSIEFTDQSICDQAGKIDKLGRCALMYAIETHNTALMSSLLALESPLPYMRRRSGAELPEDAERPLTLNIIDYILDIGAYVALPPICAYYAANPTTFMRSLPFNKRDGLYVTKKTELMSLIEDGKFHADQTAAAHLCDYEKISTFDQGRMSALALAASRGELESVCALLRELCIYLSPLKPALHYAIRAQNINCANLLLAETALWGGTYLMAYAALGDAPAVERLLALRVDLGKYSERGWTALMFAARYGHASCVELLIEYEAGMVTSEAYRYNEEVTALMIAIRYNHINCARLLCAREKDIVTKGGIRAIDIARTTNKREFVVLLL